MSVIMPSGGKKYDWVPKLAEDEKIGVEAMTDEELAGLVAPVAIEVEEADLAEPGETPEEEVVEVSIEEGGEEEDISGTPEDESLESDPGEGTLEERVEDLIDNVEAVKEKLEDVAEDAAEVAAMATEEGVESVEEEIGEVEEIAEDEALTAVTPGEVEEIEEECETCQYCGGAKGISSVAGDNRRFTKIAAISPENKGELKKYWVDYLGYDKDYVKWMLEDYEK